MYEAWERREKRGGGAEQHGSVALRGKSSFTAGRESTFYRNPELQMRKNEDYFLYWLHSYYVHSDTHILKVNAMR